MFTCNNKNHIIVCDFVDVKFVGEEGVSQENGGLLCREVFPYDSKWKDRQLLHTAVRAYASRTGWQICLKHRTNIKCSYWQSINSDEE